MLQWKEEVCEKAIFSYYNSRYAAVQSSKIAAEQRRGRRDAH